MERNDEHCWVGIEKEKRNLKVYLWTSESSIKINNKRLKSKNRNASKYKFDKYSLIINPKNLSKAISY